MGSKRARKARKRTKREARRETRRARDASTQSGETGSTSVAATRARVDYVLLTPHAAEATGNPLIGYLVHDGVRTLCDGDGCVIAGSRDKIREIRTRFGSRFANMQTIQPAPFSDIWSGMRRGGAYCFDEEAYGRFLAPSRRVGMTLSDEDFSDPGPLGMHFVRVQLLNVDL